MSDGTLRLAVLGFPSEHLFGGGLTLLSRIGPAIQAAGGQMAWVDQFYAQDADHLARWEREGVIAIPLVQPRRWFRRWLQPDPIAACETRLREFRPNVVIVAVGGDRRYPGDGWEMKQRLTELAKAQGARVVIMHQLSEAGLWLEPGAENDRWLAWQRSADWHQFVSEGTWRETEANFGFSLPGEVIRNNCNVPYRQPPPWPEGDLLRLAFVGRFRIHQKGLDLLLDAVSRPELRAQPGWRLSLIGGGAMQPRLEAEIARRGLGDRVVVRGHTADVPGIWREHHLLVMPSRAEGLSLALCEAMLSERPAIGTGVGGTNDLLVDGETGFAAQLDAGSLAEAILRAGEAHRAGRLAALGRSAGARARDVFPPDPERSYVAQLVALLQRPSPASAPA
jgi:glycosyltransferase involved in cell wall biosynthesis